MKALSQTRSEAVEAMKQIGAVTLQQFVRPYEAGARCSFCGQRVLTEPLLWKPIRAPLMAPPRGWRHLVLTADAPGGRCESVH